MTESLRGAASPTPFDLLADEIIVHGFSFLSQKDLGRVAQVSSLFKRIADSNECWKPAYMNCAGITRWIGSPPTSWKDHARGVSECVKKGELFLWKMGYANEALHYLMHPPTVHRVLNDHLEDEDWEPFFALEDEAQEPLRPSSFQQWVQGLLTPAEVLEAYHAENIYEVVIQILKQIELDCFEAAYQLFRKHRPDFIQQSPFLGGWISLLLANVISPQDRIHPPKRLRSTDKENPEFLQGTALFWLRREKYHLSLATLEYCAILWQKINLNTDDASTRAAFSNYFKEKIFQINLPIPTVEEFSHLFLDYFPKFSAELLIKIIENTSQLMLETRLRIAAKLAHALSKIDDETVSHWTQKIVDIFLEHPKEAKKFISRFNVLFLSLLYLVTKFKVESAYSWILEVPFSLPEEANTQIQLYSDLIKLYCRNNQMAKAITCLAKLTALHVPHVNTAQESDINRNFLKTLYQLSQEEPRLAQEVLALDPQNTEIIIAQAYAIFKSGRVNEALLHLFKYADEYKFFYKLELLEWLKELAKSNFKAALAYSLFLHEEQALIHHFANLFDTPTPHFLIYHNVAVRLYFTLNVEASEKYLKEALKLDSTREESKALKMKIDHVNWSYFDLEGEDEKYLGLSQNDLLLTPE